MKLILSFILIVFLSINLHSQELETAATTFPDANSSAIVNVNANNNTVTFTLTGPMDRFFALAYGSFTNGMTAGNDIFWVTESGGNVVVVDGRTAGFTVPQTDGSQDLTLVSNTDNTPSAGIRTVVVTRTLNTSDSNDFTFTGTESDIDLAMVQASSSSYSISAHGGGSNADNALNTPFQNLGVEDIDNKNLATNIYPNPIVNSFKIESNAAIQSVNVYSTQGDLLNQFTESENYDISAYLKGIYFAEILFEDGEIIYKKIIKL